MCARRPPSELPESVSGTAPAAPPALEMVFLPPGQTGKLTMDGTLGRGPYKVSSPCRAVSSPQPSTAADLPTDHRGVALFPGNELSP